MVFRKVLFMWSSMPIFSFIGYTLTELFRKLKIDDKFINKRVRLFIHQTMYKSCEYVITRLRNSCLITFLKKYRSSHRRKRSSNQRGSVKKVFLELLQTSRESTCVGVFFNKVAGFQSASFLKRDFNSGAFLWSFQNF